MQVPATTCSSTCRCQPLLWGCCTGSCSSRKPRSSKRWACDQNSAELPQVLPLPVAQPCACQASACPLLGAVLQCQCCTRDAGQANATFFKVSFTDPLHFAPAVPQHAPHSNEKRQRASSRARDQWKGRVGSSVVTDAWEVLCGSIMQEVGPRGQKQLYPTLPRDTRGCFGELAPSEKTLS